MRRSDDRLVPVSIRASGDVGCYAAAVQLRFSPNGVVMACCRSLLPLGNVHTDRLRAMWDGASRRRQAEHLARGDFSAGCQQCEGEIRLEGRPASYPTNYDMWEGRLDPAAVLEWPRRMEFNLSNACNLQCLQCDGESSSAIRVHREGRPPIPQVYGDEFFDDLREFLPHLDEVVFGGGEPFLGPENFRVWDLMAELAPGLDCTVITNATQWTPRVQRVLEQVPMAFVISLDGITPSTYEEIRKGADLDRVLENVDRYAAVARANGRPVSVNHCLMPQNVHEFPQFLNWAESKGFPVDISLVRSPAWCSIGRLSVEEIRRIRDDLLSRADEVAGLVLNRATWDAELVRISAWADAPDGEVPGSGRTVMFFRCQGAGPVDPAPVRAELRPFASDGLVHEVVVGSDDLVHHCDETLSTDAPYLTGQPVTMVTKAVEARYGAMTGFEVVRNGDDVVLATAMFGSHEAQLAYVARRDDRGWADDVSILLAFRPSAGTLAAAG